MKCPFCGAQDTKVIDSRPADDNSSIRRRRQCEECGKRFTTYEKLETLPLMIIKKDDSREPYNRAKIENGIPSVTIGELVMKKLKMVDEVAYVRFASVYREFKDVNAFMDELAKFLNNK